jgi:hypothetical protein
MAVLPVQNFTYTQIMALLPVRNLIYGAAMAALLFLSKIIEAYGYGSSSFLNLGFGHTMSGFLCRFQNPPRSYSWLFSPVQNSTYDPSSGMAASFLSTTQLSLR